MITTATITIKEKKTRIHKYMPLFVNNHNEYFNTLKNITLLNIGEWIYSWDLYRVMKTNKKKCVTIPKMVCKVNNGIKRNQNGS